ncbi:phosphatase PAP2 family protein [Neobacillus terrae]|uniref:phosphatase PAP2 family protein n=1 Tax=Neobacillus terrae TaxID=3034837 RepID=UPI00140E7498|nr:phosphatase PAP2 family protein [Neobacillus terrae]NHM31038.1 phosphatase PAP2 family protein [Neobacillus terrae]
MKKYLLKAPYLLLLSVWPVLGLIYQVLNEHPQKAADISTSFDHNIPFIPIFIIPYILWYAYMFVYLVYFCFKDTKVYIKTLIMIVLAELVCFTIYFFFQTTVPRPDPQGNTQIIHLVKSIYANDQPYNCFPSIHVLTTFSIMLGSLNLQKKHLLNTISIHLFGSLIIISTLFVKQHVILDMIGSMFLTTFIYGIVFEISNLWVSQKSEAVYVKNKG